MQICDTFRAGAVQQLRDRMNLLNVETISESRKDPASLAYHALDRAIKSGGDATIKPKIQISAGGVCYAEVLTEGKEVT